MQPATPSLCVGGEGEGHLAATHMQLHARYACKHDKCMKLTLDQFTFLGLRRLDEETPSFMQDLRIDTGSLDLCTVR